MYQIRTDLALETQEKMQEDKVELKGVRFSEEHVSKNLTISTVVIETENGASNRVVAFRDGKFVDYDINEALAMKKTISPYEYEVSKMLSR